MPGSQDISKGRTGKDCERGMGGQPRQSGVAGWRFLSALNATVKNLDFSPSSEMDLEGE